MVLCSRGVRLTAIAHDIRERRPARVRQLAIVCFGLCGIAVMYGLHLIIPYFSK